MSGRKDTLADDEPITDLEYGANVQRVENLVRFDLAVGHLQRCEKAVRRASLQRGQPDRPLLAVLLGVLRGELARSLLASQGCTIGKLDDRIVSREGRRPLPSAADIAAT